MARCGDPICQLGDLRFTHFRSDELGDAFFVRVG